MMLTNEELDILVLESDKLMLTPEYKSEALYTVLHSFIFHIYNLKRYRGYPKFVLETAELAAIEKCYKAIPKYNKAKADKARNNRGLSANHKKGIYRFLEVVITNSIYTSFSKTSKMSDIERRTYSLNEYDESGNMILDLADINYNGIEDIENYIDSKARDKRAKEFLKRLDRIQKELDNEPRE